MTIDRRLEEDLVAMAERDQQALRDLFEAGELPCDGYHPRMREIHERNASSLKAIVAERGWPDKTVAGPRGAEAAWLIAQHCVSDLSFMVACADRIEPCVADGRVEGWQLAFLRDRIRVMTGQKQIYGTQFEAAPNGMPVPCPIEDPAGVDRRRRAVGLNSLAERIAEMRARWEEQRKAGGRGHVG